MKCLPPVLATLCALAVSSAASAASSASAPAAARDEVLARRLLHCANVAEVWAEYLQQHGDGANSENQVKVRNLFVIAAETAADPQFVQKIQPTEFASVKALLDRQQKEKKDLVTPETTSCTETYKQHVPALLQRAAALSSAAASAASAPAAASGAR